MIMRHKGSVFQFHVTVVLFLLMICGLVSLVVWAGKLDGERLAKDRKVWVEPAKHDVDVAMMDHLQKWGRWRLVAEREEADLVVKLAVSGSAIWGRAKVQAFVVDARSKETLYTSKVQTGTRTIFYGYASPYSRAVSGIVEQMQKEIR